jgi:hypothetical protein
MAVPKSTNRPVIGWREWVHLPDLGETTIKAKVDTGARTSALHAFDLDLVESEGTTYASFEVHPEQRSARGSVRLTIPVQSYRNVRSSDGRIEQRPVIVTDLSLGGGTWPIEMTLTSRDEMGFRMLLGRAAIRKRFLVHPGRSFLQSAESQKGTRS